MYGKDMWITFTQNWLHALKKRNKQDLRHTLKEHSASTAQYHVPYRDRLSKENEQLRAPMGHVFRNARKQRGEVRLKVRPSNHTQA